MTYKLDEVSILVVEDTLPMLILAKSLLHIFGFRNILLAKNGKEGFERYLKESPDIIVTDWLMEPMSGLDLIKEIRNGEDSPNPYIPIVMMTGFASRERVEKARDLGATEFLIKPYTAKDLYNKLVQLIEKPREFAKCESFFGPDRRRSKRKYNGPCRREDDQEAENQTQKKN